MAFEKAFENNYNDLSDNTKYRFAEMELGRASKILTDFYQNFPLPRETAIHHLFSLVAPNHLKMDDENEHVFQQVLNSPIVLNPPKVHEIHYLIIHGCSYQKIRDLTGASFNTISKERYTTPEYVPIFPHWDKIMLMNWNRVKAQLNLWNEPLVHDASSY